MTSDKERIDDAAFGVIYGAITVLSMLMTLDSEASQPLLTAAYVFVAVLAVALAKAFAELSDAALKHKQPATSKSVEKVWHHSRTLLIAANGPTIAIALAYFDLYSISVGLNLAKAVAVSLLVFYGTRVGRRLGNTAAAGFIGGTVTGGMGALLALLKIVLH